MLMWDAFLDWFIVLGNVRGSDRPGTWILVKVIVVLVVIAALILGLAALLHA